MADLENGTLVQHNTLGVDKIVALEANAIPRALPGQLQAVHCKAVASRGALRPLSTQLFDKLKPNGAKDFIDVQSFLHVTSAAKHHVSRGDGAASTRKPREGTREEHRRTNPRRTP